MTTPTYMDQNAADLVRLIKNGAIFLRKAADNPTVPTGTAWTPAGTDKKLGYYSEDGFTLHPEPGDETEFVAMNGDIVITEQAPGYWTIAFSGLESNQVTVETYFDTELGGDGSVTITSAATSTEYDLVIAGLDQHDDLIIGHFPRVKVNAREDIVFNRTTLVLFGMTFRTFKGRAAAPYHLRAWGFVPNFPLEAAAPTVSAATPADAGEDELVTIIGTGFAGTTDVDFGATAANGFTVYNDSLLIASVPAGAAGAANITVTNATGTSSAFPYTRTV